MAPHLSITEAEAEQHTEQDENTSRLSASSKTTCDFHFQKHPSISLPFEEDMETDTSCSYPSHTIDTSTLQTATTSLDKFNDNTNSKYIPSLDTTWGGQYQARSLESILGDNSAFVADSSGKKEVAKFHNALHKPLLDTRIELDNVSPPYLHILLGIVLKHHKLLEEVAHKLDTEKSTEKDDLLTPMGLSLKNHGSNWRQLRNLEDKKQMEEGQAVFSETQEEFNKHIGVVEDLYDELELSNIPHTPLTPRSGPIASALDTVLNIEQTQDNTTSIPQ
ncbi:hypothetical protein ElyMa_001861500 [Elysia marginata]|uniref:Uncharacterized protein n=1 Tax=Elysia marginata TaxID=1093978 RepID=A0AAV4ENK9_9GAST|nr:hypothetical protein ElyMa_001861500 [Elysia marginata]